jgi:uncharacterized protein (DUF2141 family)
MRKLLIILAVTGIWGRGRVSAQGYTLTVNVVKLRSDAGKLYLSLYNSGEGYPKNASAAFRLSTSVIQHGRARIVLDRIAAGTYAIACFHDENNNGKLDTNFFGKPTEGTGASNDARGSLGPPKFRDAKFAVDGNKTINITIFY